MNLIRSVDQNLTLVLSWSALVARQVVSQDIQGDLRRNACTAFKNHLDHQTFSNTILTLKPHTHSETEGSREYLKLCCAHPLNFGKITPKATLHLTMFPVGPSSWCLVFYSLGVVRLLTQLWVALADLRTLLYSGQETSFKSINYSSALCSILRGGEHHILQETYMRV